MKTRYNVKGTDGETLAKRMMKLAWDKSTVAGYGFFQDRGAQTEDAVWENTRRRGDYCFGDDAQKINGFAPKSGEASADYVFGRMMKLHYDFGADFIEVYDSEWRRDYQSFCYAYKNFDALIKAAAESLGAEAERI